MSDADEGDFDGFEGAVEIKIEAGELADDKLVVDAHASVNYIAAVAIGFEADARFELLDLCGVLWSARGSRLFRFFGGRLFRWFSRLLGERIGRTQR